MILWEVRNHMSSKSFSNCYIWKVSVTQWEINPGKWMYSGLKIGSGSHWSQPVDKSWINSTNRSLLETAQIFSSKIWLHPIKIVTFLGHVSHWKRPRMFANYAKNSEIIMLMWLPINFWDYQCDEKEYSSIHTLVLTSRLLSINKNH